MIQIWMWLLLAAIVLAVLLIIFVVIARKGRELRKSHSFPPKATRAFLQWTQDGQKCRIEIEAPFYFGNHPRCDVVLSRAGAAYEACIFYHHERFALQALPEGSELTINGEPSMAGYLRDGDVLVIAHQTFAFHCH